MVGQGGEPGVSSCLHAKYSVFLLAVILSLPIIELLDPETKSKNSDFLLT